MSKPKITPSTNLYLHNKDDQIKHVTIIILGFWFTYYMCFLLENPIDTFLSSLIPMRSEYTVGEQLSKFYLFIIVLISVFSYRVLKELTAIKLSMSFLLLGLIMYMSESNMISEKVQPIFGLIIVAYTSMLLLRARFWLSFALFVVGFTFITGGVLSDLAHENESISSLLPVFIIQLLHITSEERFDATGIALLCLSAILCFRVPLRYFITKNTKGTLLMLLASGMIAAGNGFLHYQYHPSGKLRLGALAMTIIGFLGLMFVNKSISKKDAVLTLITENLFYLFIFFFFVVLPSVYGNQESSTSLLLWFPFMLFMAVCLWRRHPANNEGVNGLEMAKWSKNYETYDNFRNLKTLFAFLSGSRVGDK